ncbi:PIN domain-like protein [Mycena vulgaris]|nr:PIN domain-like protein [Mycena vulgaris]
MGIPGLHKIIGPAVQHRSFKQLSVAEGLKQNRRGHGTLRIGVDSSIWMSQCTAVFQAPGLHFQAGENPELCALFYKICELSKYCVTAIFVFDGPGRPDIKRGKQVIDRPHWITEHFQAMISAFGFYHYTAREAEAELAQLNRMNIIDGVFTTDGDVLVFGATHMISSKDDYKELQIFTAAAIESSVHLTLGGLLLMAILIGGDYDDGLDGCAEKTAHALAKRGLGDTLLQATQTMAPADLDVFLGRWRQTLRTELVEGKSGRKHPAIAAAVSDAFPNPKVLHLYVHPLTSWSQDGLGVDSSSWLPRLPDVFAIAKLCELLFSWGTPAELPSKMCDHVLPGLCIRRLAQPRNELQALQKHFAGGYNAEEQLSLSIFLSITMFSNEHYRVEVSTRLFQGTIQSALRGVRPNRSGKKYTSPVTKVVVPIPPSILLHSLPAMVSLYEKRTHKKNIAYRAEKIFPSVRPTANL